MIYLYVSFIIIVLFITFKINIFRKQEKFNLDNVYIVSMKSATDRRSKMKKQLQKYNINYQFFDGLTPETNKDVVVLNKKLRSYEIGCALSHRALWKKCVEINKPIFVFEDDVIINEKFREDIKEINNLKWDIVYLGHCYNKTNKQVSKNFGQFNWAQCTHAYYITPYVSQILLKKTKIIYMPIDQMMAKIINDSNYNIKGLLTPKLNALISLPSSIKQDWQINKNLD